MDIVHRQCDTVFPSKTLTRQRHEDPSALRGRSVSPPPNPSVLPIPPVPTPRLDRHCVPFFGAG